MEQIPIFPTLDKKERKRLLKYERELRKALVKRYVTLSLTMNCKITSEIFFKYSGFSKSLFYNSPYAVFRTFKELKKAAKKNA